MNQSPTQQHYVLHTLGIACILAAACTPAFAAEPPNIILVLGDDHGGDERAYNGHPHLTTPVLDEMAATGLRLDNFYAAPLCSPTRGTVITGRHQNRYGTFIPNWSIRPEEISIAQIAGKAGYARAHFGKWHIGPVKAGSPTNPGAMGFEEWLSHDNFFEIDPILSWNGAAPEQFKGESSEIMVQEAIRFIGKAKQQERPFFTVIWFGSPHQPYSGVDKDLAMYEDLPEEYQGRTVGMTSHETGELVSRPLTEVLQARYAEITAMDRAIGTLREYLADEGLRQNTILWYCGDNGTPGGVNVTTPLRGNKGQVYEGGTRVPAVIEWPAGIPSPRVSDVISCTSDMLPTLCDLVGQPLPDRPLDGISLKPIFEGKMTERPSPIFFWSYDPSHEPTNNAKPYIDPKLQQGTTPLVKRMDGLLTRNFLNYHHTVITERDFEGPKAVLDNRYKLVVDALPGGTGSELFDLRNDPGEKNNLIESKPEIAKDLNQQLLGWQHSVLNSLAGGDY